ncbi:MAG: hypothetical protein H7336_03675 [Bacteriovorax sp.]|nr:hypothetical protein [Bacteriovorax sp.]
MKINVEQFRNKSFLVIEKLIHNSHRFDENTLVMRVDKSTYICQCGEASDLAYVRFSLLRFLTAETVKNIPPDFLTKVNIQVPCLYFFCDDDNFLCCSFTTLANSEKYLTNDVILTALSVIESGVTSVMSNLEKLKMMKIIKDALN